jgi:hypothetical protein
VGTRYEDQPTEHWAGPESLDPTPVWKQYLLVLAFVVLALVLVAFVSYTALAVDLATPPASVIGGRVVLATSDVPAVGGAARLYGAPLVDAQHAFYLLQYKSGVFVAVRAADFQHISPSELLTVNEYSKAGPPPSFDHYLVSVEGTKVVVNTSRLITGTQVVPGPSPTR